MKSTYRNLGLAAVAILGVALTVAAHAQDTQRGHGRGRGPGSDFPGLTPSATPPGNHFGWERGRHNPHKSTPTPTPAPTATPTTPTPTATPDNTTPTPTPTATP